MLLCPFDHRVGAVIMIVTQHCFGLCKVCKLSGHGNMFALATVNWRFFTHELRIILSAAADCGPRATSAIHGPVRAPRARWRSAAAAHVVQLPSGTKKTHWWRMHTRDSCWL
jgi:hypothetical protein